MLEDTRIKIFLTVIECGNFTAAANKLGGAGGPLAVYVVTIFAAEFGKAVSKETKTGSTPPSTIGICPMPCRRRAVSATGRLSAGT